MKKIVYVFLIILLVPFFVYAEDIDYLSTEYISANTNESNREYVSKMGGKNVLVVISGDSTLKNCTFDKRGDSTYSMADIYGTNAAVVVTNGSLNLDGGKVSTDGKYASGVFSYEKGKTIVSDLTINTLADYSFGIVSSKGGSITANNISVKTDGNESPAIKAFEKDSEIIVKGGKYETNGKNSPIVYSTGKVSISDAELNSSASVGIVAEDEGIISLNNVRIVDTNYIYSSNSSRYRNIFLYQTMEEDAMARVITFSSKDSSIKTNRGDTLFVTNAKSVISLENNEIENSNGDFLVIQAGAYGKFGANGGNVNLSLNNQKVDGNILVDSISSLEISMDNKSILKGTINAENASKNVTVKLSSDSVWSLSGDAYITSLENSDSENNNIYSNGKYKLYVSGKEQTINGNNYDSNETSPSSSSKKSNNQSGGGSLWIVFIIIALILGGGAYYLVYRAKVNNSF